MAAPVAAIRSSPEAANRSVGASPDRRSRSGVERVPSGATPDVTGSSNLDACLPLRDEFASSPRASFWCVMSAVVHPNALVFLVDGYPRRSAAEAHVLRWTTASEAIQGAAIRAYVSYLQDHCQDGWRNIHQLRREIAAQGVYTNLFAPQSSASAVASAPRNVHDPATTPSAECALALPLATRLSEGRGAGTAGHAPWLGAGAGARADPFQRFRTVVAGEIWPPSTDGRKMLHVAISRRLSLSRTVPTSIVPPWGPPSLSLGRSDRSRVTSTASDWSSARATAACSSTGCAVAAWLHSSPTQHRRLMKPAALSRKLNCG